MRSSASGKSTATRFSLTGKITLAVSLLVTIYLSAMALVGQIYFEQEFKKSISNQQFTLVAALADEIDLKLLAAQDELVSVARILEQLSIDQTEAMQRFLEERIDTRHVFDNGLIYFSADGTMLAVAPMHADLIGKNFAFRDYFQKTLTTKKAQISEPIISAQSHHHPILMFTAPLFDQTGQIKGILTGSIDLLKDNFLGRIPTVKKVGQGGYLYLFDRRRQLIVHPDPSRIMQPNDIKPGDNPGIEKALEGFEGTIETHNSRGLHVLASFKRLTATDWILAANYPVAEAFAPLDKARAVFWPGLAIAVLLAILLVSRFIKYLTQPLRILTTQVGGVAVDLGEIAPIPVTGSDEIASLARTFNQLLNHINRNQAAMGEQVQFLQCLIDTLPNPIYFKDAELRYLGCNRAFETYLGINRSDLIGKSVFEIAPADLALRYDQADLKLLQQQTMQHYESTVTYADGSRREVIFYKAVFTDANGKPGGLIGTFVDISERKEAEEKVLAQKEFSDSLVQNSAVPTFVLDAKHRVIAWNRACEELTGLGANEILGTSDHWRAFYPHPRPCLADIVLGQQTEQLDTLYATHAPSRLAPGGLQAENWFKHLNGKDRYILFSAAPIYNQQGEILAVIETLEDQTAQRQALEQLNKLGQVLEQNPASVIITDSNGVIEYVNPKFTSVTGYRNDEVIGKTPNILKTGHTDPDEYRNLWDTIRAGREWRGEFLNKKKNGDFYWEAAVISPVCAANGHITHFVAVKEDITERKAAEESLQEKDMHLHYLSHHDALTGLPNRLLLQDRLLHAIGKADRLHTQVALLLLDLDRFKNINDSLGHDVGDELLVQVARRIKACLRETDTIARFGGDEFVVILEEIRQIEKVAQLAKKLQQALTEVARVGAHELYISSSIGISLYPNDGHEVETLLSSADVAMYRAKAQGRNTYTFYTADMNARTHEFLLLESGLRRALDQDQLVLFYQPQIDLATRTIIGAEALIRWIDPQRGMISPADFIPLAEETGMIVAIGRWVLQSACAQLKRRQEMGCPPIPIAVNISGRQFKQPAFVDMLVDILSEHDLDPQWLELEITESVIMENVDEAILTLTDLRVRGFKLAIDDFGTGYSSLSYLKRFPISKLKIDRSFVRDITSDENDAAIVASVIALTKSMELQVIAEGVETEDQVRFLIERGCLQGQGFLFSRPLPAEEFENLCQKGLFR